MYSASNVIDRTEQVTPIQQISKQLEKHAANAAQQKVVLLATGSYNPIHRKVHRSLLFSLLILKARRSLGTCKAVAGRAI